jgi:hypothetical protein
MPISTFAIEAVGRHRVLERATLLYISLPFLVFAGGWLLPVVAVPVIALTLAGLYLAQRAEPVAGAPSSASSGLASKQIASYVFILVVVVFVVVFSGTGGFAVARGGHFRNHSFILDLMRFPWPLGFQALGPERQPGVVAFYIGNAILPGLWGSFFDWVGALRFQFAWTCLGVFLAACWFLRVIGRSGPQWALLFLFFGGLDLIGWWAVNGWYSELSQPPDLWMHHYASDAPRMGGMFWIFPSNMTILFRSPHHVLCAWLALLVIVDDAVNRGTCRRAGFVAAFCLLWSAFSFVGLAPFVLVALVATRARGMLSFENGVAGVTVLAVSALYISSNNGVFVQGPLWEFQNLLETWPILVLALVLDVGIYALLCSLLERDTGGLAHPLWRWAGIATLLLVPWYRMGKFCDFTTKASIPALLVLQLCVAHALAGTTRERRWRAAALVAVVVFGSVSAIALIGDPLRAGLRWRPPPVQQVKPISRLARMDQGDQLFSDGRGFFWRVLAKPVEYKAPLRFKAGSGARAGKRKAGRSR